MGHVSILTGVNHLFRTDMRPWARAGCVVCVVRWSRRRMSKKSSFFRLTCLFAPCAQRTEPLCLRQFWVEMFTKWKKIERNSFNLLLQTNPYSSLTLLENIQPWEVGGGEMTQTETDTNTLRHSPVLGTTGKQNSRTLL